VNGAEKIAKMATSTVYEAIPEVTTLRASGKYFLMPIFMSPPINFLRIYRKRSPLTQSDIAYLLELPDYSSISRYEKSQRTPSIELLLVYHHLFNTSIEIFFEPQSYETLPVLVERIEHLISDLKKQDDVQNHTSRIKFLEEVLIRLTN
jgi:transcriptional regulator with XRE-family HTH domain